MTKLFSKSARSMPALPGTRAGRIAVATAAVTLIACPADAHEAWLLTPSEVELLALQPIPDLFKSIPAMTAASLIGALAALAGLRVEARVLDFEARISAPAAALAPQLGPILLRLSLAAMLALAALGGLPRHGTAPWAEPTLFVPDMQLSLAPGWGSLAIAQAILAAFLAAGLLTRGAGLALAALSLLGLAAFGPTFTAYAPHFIAPGLMLAVCGGGALSLDRRLGTENWLRPQARLAQAGWNVAIALIGGGFVYLGITYKLTQPTLIIAILEHGHVPVLGLPLPVVALLMAGVEVIAGTLFALRRLTRPIAIFLIGAFTFFAFSLGESPFMHANLYGAVGFCLLSGRAFRHPGQLDAGMQAVRP